MNYSFTLVCQGGRLELPSILLVSSLLYYLKCEYEIHVGVPDYDGVLKPKPETLEFFKYHGIKISYIINEVDITYPIANKLSCIKIPNSSDKTVFLDSDIICMRPFHGLNKKYNAPFAAKLTDLADFNEQEWIQIYELQGKNLPKLNYRSTVTNIAMPLVFNSGVIFVDSNINFGDSWLQISNDIDKITKIPKRRPFLDQISLPFVLDYMKLEFDLLTEKYNFPSEIRPIDPLDIPYFCHYHDIVQIFAEEHLCKLVSTLSKKISGLSELLPVDILNSKSFC